MGTTETAQNDATAKGVGLETLRIQMRREEMKTLELLESWGASLFLGAIALIAKQIIDWSATPTAGCPNPVVTLHWPIYLLPALIGLVAFVFLRAVNFRIRRLRGQLYKLTNSDNGGDKKSWGAVGWLMALMPLIFGYAATAYLRTGKPDLQEEFCILTSITLAAVIIGIHVFWSSKRDCEESESSDVKGQN